MSDQPVPEEGSASEPVEPVKPIEPTATDATDDNDEEVVGEGGPTLLDMFLYGPVDALFSLLRDPRGSATRGHARVDQALRQARALGELTVRFGSSEIRRRTESKSDDAAGGNDTDPAAAPRRAAGPAPDDVIADYDALSASQIIPLLQGLDTTERARVAAYEQEARGRQTILRRIAQLDGTGA